jgi:MoaA/NifB/PqqE/SkfB family radical SAM enzyme
MHHPQHPHALKKEVDQDQSGPPALRLVAWETTRNCNLNCVHCRAAATCGPYTGELDTQAAFTLLDQIAEVAKPIIILTGGEPLLREDIFDIARYGNDKGMRMVMSPNGTLVTKEIAIQMANAGIQRISVSLDGSTAEQHDTFRGVKGAYEGALQGIQNAKAAGIDFQINTTITKTNLEQIPKILALAESLGAVAHHIFLLVPTGRGKYIVDQEIDPQQYEDTLNWFYDQRNKTSLQLKATCAPHYYRILRQRAREEGQTVTFESHGLDAVTRGCLAAPVSALSPTVVSFNPADFWISIAGISPGNLLGRYGPTPSISINYEISGRWKTSAAIVSIGVYVAGAGPGHLKPQETIWPRNHCAYISRRTNLH